MKLLSTSNTKTVKGQKKGYMTFILHLAPADLSGFNVCPKASAGCKAACLNTAGRGAMSSVQEARVRKTRYLYENRDQFLKQLTTEIRKAVKAAERKGMIPCFRLNGTSDISWEKYGIIEQFPDVQFYDYTKVRNRKVARLPNYHLTFSKADGNDSDVDWAIANGYNVAVVFAGELPETYKGRRVVNGDDTDLRFLDGENVIVGLTAKGKAKRDTSGFVVH